MQIRMVFLLVLLAGCSCSSGSEAYAEVEAEGFDIAPFARVVTCDPARHSGARSGRVEEFRPDDVFLEWPIPELPAGGYKVPLFENHTGCIGLQWAERRLLQEVGITFAADTSLPSLDEIKVEYWSSEGRTDDWANVGQTLWQGAWRELPGDLVQQAHSFKLLVDTSKVTEFSDRSGSQKVRWIFPANTDTLVVEQLTALSELGSAVATGAFHIEMETPAPGQSGEVALYNGYIVSQVEEGSEHSHTAYRTTWDLSKPLELRIRFVAAPGQRDRALIRLRLPDGAFSVAVDDVQTHGQVYVEDFGVYVATQPLLKTLAQYKSEIQGRQTILQRVEEMPDQTFDQALKKLLRPSVANVDPLLLSLACDNHKYEIRRDGGIYLLSPEYSHVLGQYSYNIIPTFGTQEKSVITRELEDQWLPIPVMTVRDGVLTYRQRTFVVGYEKKGDAGLKPWLNEKPLCVSQYQVQNPRLFPVRYQLTFSVNRNVLTGEPDAAWPFYRNESHWAPHNDLARNEGGVVIADGARLLAFLECKPQHECDIGIEGNKITLSGWVPAQSTLEYVLYLPGWPIEQDAYQQLSGGEDMLSEVKEYWKGILSQGMQIDIPDSFLSATIKASMVNIYLAARNENGGELVVPWCGSVEYGPLDTESQGVIMGMDRMGQSLFARKSLDYFTARYNDQGYMTTTYTLMGTGEHLWAAGNHYLLTRDKEWLKSVSCTLKKACEWIIRERSYTKRLDANGEKMPEYGLVPPGVLADWGRYAYYFYAQGYFYAALEAMSEAFEDVDPPYARRLRDEARDFREDILRAYKWNQARMPVCALQDGSWVPAYPSSLYCYGPTRYFYNDVGAVGVDIEVGGSHLILQGVIPPDSDDGRWITNFMEDYWYLKSPVMYISYPSADMDKDWFTYGGFSKIQQYYTRSAQLYAKLNQVKPFVRSYFNALPPTLSPETLAFWETFALGPYLWNKTAETGKFLDQTRDMFVYERGKDLWLAPYVTNSWLQDGRHISVRNAPTRFGAVSYEIISQVDNGLIEATIASPGALRPQSIVLRLRHPDGATMQSVSVNGKSWNDFDAQEEIIRLKSESEAIHVRAYFRQ